MFGLKIIKTSILAIVILSIHCHHMPNSPNIVNKLENELILIPSGDFQMGFGAINSDEYPIHNVHITAFYMDNILITQEYYYEVTNEFPSYFHGEQNMPVEFVTWFDAVLFCNKRSKLAKLDTVYKYKEAILTDSGCIKLDSLLVDTSKSGYRLPTEAEWEYACRAGTESIYYWGNDTTYDIINKYAWYQANSLKKTHSVKQKFPNKWGLYDINGNVYEWCNDWYGKYDSTDQNNPLGPKNGILKVMRGGSWWEHQVRLRSSYRNHYDPQLRHWLIGFRCVRKY